MPPPELWNHGGVKQMRDSNILLHRLATPADAFELIRLHQLSASGGRPDPLLLDCRRLQEDLRSDDCRWAVAERGGALEALVSLDIETGNRMAKIRRMRATGPEAGHHELLSRTLGFLMEQLKREAAVDVVYSTTRALTLEQQATTLDHGFHILGVFPNAVSADSHKLNGLTGWYAHGVLHRKRYSDFSLHPTVRPFYDLARAQCGLPALPEAAVPALAGYPDTLPTIEMIEAPSFVAEKFRRLQARKNLSVHFYPFQTPNVLFTNPDEKVEVFATVLREDHFATIIGEHLAATVHPVTLYRTISRILYENQIHYIEVINDAADVQGIECILRAGYSPCGYFPCLKNAGDRRRDYVVFARSFEFFTYTPFQVHPFYSDYLVEFCRVRSTFPKRDNAIPSSA